ncbi:MAG: hypothetical protein WCK13_10300 [Ignavibacteriota bacterium]|nr:hypothetical protein [Ignavibacteriota bacterium]
MNKIITILFALFVFTTITKTLQSQDFSGTYSESNSSKLVISTENEGYTLTFTDYGNIYAVGKGYVIGGKLYFTFYRTDKSSEGGFGIYSLNVNNISANHFNLDFSKRWNGTYKKD